jgi:hypothetical protein
LVNRRNRGLEDIAFRTVVTYDWLPQVDQPQAEPSVAARPISNTLMSHTTVTIGETEFLEAVRDVDYAAANTIPRG